MHALQYLLHVYTYMIMIIYRSVRSFYGSDEACFIMDARVRGNIGRYLNVTYIFYVFKIGNTCFYFH